MDDIFGNIIFQMESKFNKYFRPIPHIFGIGVLIDPCLKEIGLRSLLQSLYGGQIIDLDDGSTLTATTHYLAIRNYFQTLYDEYAARYGVATQQSIASAPSASSTGRGKSVSFDRYAMVAELTGGSGTSSGLEVSEIDEYLSASLVKCQGNALDILQWWKVYGSVSYPILSTMVRDLLSVQVSTVASESAFSTAGRLIDDHRTCLDPYTVQAVMCLQDWWRYEKRTQGIDRMAGIEDKFEELGLADRYKE